MFNLCEYPCSYTMLRDETKHFLLSITAGLIIGAIFDNYWSVPIALLSGFFIDSDHLIDYGIYKKFRGFNLAEFLSGKFFDYAGKVYIFFHGFEYIVAFIILALIWPAQNWLFFALALSLLFHLSFDTIHNRTKWQSYSIIFRVIHHFNHKDFEFKKRQIH